MGVPTSDDEGEGRSGRASSRSRIVQGNNSACASGDVGGGGRLARGDGWRGDSSACAPTPRRPTRDGESVAVPNAGDEAPDARGAEASSSSGLKSWRDKRHCDMRSALLMSAAARVGSRGCARGLRPGDATTTPRLVQLQRENCSLHTRRRVLREAISQIRPRWWCPSLWRFSLKKELKSAVSAEILRVSPPRIRSVSHRC